MNLPDREERPYSLGHAMEILPSGKTCHQRVVLSHESSRSGSRLETGEARPQDLTAIGAQRMMAKPLSITRPARRWRRKSGGSGLPVDPFRDVRHTSAVRLHDVLASPALDGAQEVVGVVRVPR